LGDKRANSDEVKQLLLWSLSGRVVLPREPQRLLAPGFQQLLDLTETSVICFEVSPSLKTNMVPAPTQAPVLALRIGSPLLNKTSWPFLISNEDLY
jgi:hypothetical protein